MWRWRRVGQELQRPLRERLLLPPGWGPRAGAAAASLPSASPGGLYEALAESAPVHWAESGLVALQAGTGLPWWLSIVCAGAVLRTGLTLPLAAHQGHVLAKLENLQPEIENLAKHLRYEVSIRGKQLGWSEKVARFHFRKNLGRIVSELYVRDNCHPFKASLLMWIQIPVWVFVSIALRNCSVGAADSEVLAVQEQLSTGGTLWFTDLTVPDSTWILPISLGLFNLLIVEIFALRKFELSRFQKYATNFIRGLSVLMVPIAATVPSSMALYWLSSSFMGLSHNLLLRSPTFRRLCRIPRTKSDSDTPYRDIVLAFYTKMTIDVKIVADVALLFTLSLILAKGPMCSTKKPKTLPASIRLVRDPNPANTHLFKYKRYGTSHIVTQDCMQIQSVNGLPRQGNLEAVSIHNLLLGLHHANEPAVHEDWDCPSSKP